MSISVYYGRQIKPSLLVLGKDINQMKVCFELNSLP